MSCLPFLAQLENNCDSVILGGLSDEFKLMILHFENANYTMSTSGDPTVPRYVTGYKSASTVDEVLQLFSDYTGGGYSFRRNSSSISSTYQRGEVEYFENSFSVTFNGLTPESAHKLKELTQGRFVCLLVDTNLNGWFIGLDHGAVVTSWEATTGTAPTEASQISLTLTAYEATPPKAFNAKAAIEPQEH